MRVEWSQAISVARWNPGMSLIPSAPFLIVPKFMEPEKAFRCMDLYGLIHRIWL